MGKRGTRKPGSLRENVSRPQLPDHAVESAWARRIVRAEHKRVGGLNESGGIISKWLAQVRGELDLVREPSEGVELNLATAGSDGLKGEPRGRLQD